MREHKYRAWDKKECYMRHVYAVIFDDEPLSGSVLVQEADVGYDEDGTDFPIHEESLLLSEVELMQYAGRKDKNGVEIWEGDVREWVWLKRVIRAVVKWDEERAMFCAGNREGRLLSETTLIGNRYDNPKLLEAT